MTTHPTFEQSAPLREACRERCAEFGDPACWELIDRLHRQRPETPPVGPCGECLRDIGIEPGDEFFDEAAAIGLLL